MDPANLGQGTSTFTLRPATSADAAPIRALIRDVGINPTGLDWRRFVLAVTTEDEMIGCGQVKPHGDGTRELASIAVKREWRRCGVARAIIERLIADHPGVLYLMCRSSLAPFYEKFGFGVLDEAEMPPYFRRMARLAKVFGRVAKTGLAVMRLDA
ncbi:MAG: N-acetyltransferase [Chloroflexota bacterium]|nr:MAG: N-acetyltransferase [Chloroflexota bacterium]